MVLNLYRICETVNILAISDAVPAYLTLTLKSQVHLFMFYLIFVFTFALPLLLFSTSFQSWYVVRKIALRMKVFSRQSSTVSFGHF